MTVRNCYILADIIAVAAEGTLLITVEPSGKKQNYIIIPLPYMPPCIMLGCCIPICAIP